MGALKKTAVNLILLSLCPVYAASLAENIDIQPAVKQVAYTTGKRTLSEEADSFSETQKFIEFKKNQKLPIRRSIATYPRLVVVTSPVNATSTSAAEIESSQTTDDQRDNEPSSEEMINVYAREILNKKIDLMVPTTLVSYEKW